MTLPPKDCLIVKVLRSPYAHALIEEIKTDAAMKVPGDCLYILHIKMVPQQRFTLAGQTYPEFSPYDRLILDQESPVRRRWSGYCGRRDRGCCR